MKRIIHIWITALLVFFFSNNIFSDEIDLSLRDYMRLLLKNNMELEKSRLSFYRDETMLEFQKEKLKPQITLNSVPFYGFSNSKNIFSGEEEKSIFTHTVNLGTEFSSELPTGGSIALSLTDSLSYSGMGKNYLFSNSPVLSTKFVQPLFVNGGLLNTEGYSSSIKELYTSERINKLSILNYTNNYVFKKIGLYLTTLVQEKKLVLLKQKVSIYEKKLNLLEIKKKQGRSSLLDYWEQELKLKEMNKAVFDQQYLLSSDMRQIAVSIGLKGESKNLILNDILPSINIPDVLQGEKNPDVTIALLKLLNNRLAIKKEMSNYATMLGVEFSVEPQYPANSSGSKDFRESFSGLWQDNSWLEFSGNITITIPLSGYRQGRIKKESLEKEVRISELDLESEQINTKTKLDELKIKMSYLEARDKFLKDQKKYFEERKKEAESLLKIKKITPSDLEEADLNLYSAEVDLYENRVAVIMAVIEMHKLVGDDLLRLF